MVTPTKEEYIADIKDRLQSLTGARIAVEEILTDMDNDISAIHDYLKDL